MKVIRQYHYETCNLWNWVIYNNNMSNDGQIGENWVIENAVTKIEKGMLRRFGHLERINEKRLMKLIYTASVYGQVDKGGLRRNWGRLKECQVKSTLNQRVCMKTSMPVDEAKHACQDRSRWKAVVSVYLEGKKAWSICTRMYVRNISIETTHLQVYYCIYISPPRPHSGSH